MARKAGWSKMIREIVLWALALVLTLTFVTAGVAKFDNSGGWAKAFARWGYPVWFRLLIGGIEVVAAGLLLTRRTAAYGAALIIAIMLGGIATHLLQSEGRRVTDELGPLLSALVILFGRGSPAFSQKVKRLFGQNDKVEISARRLMGPAAIAGGVLWLLQWWFVGEQRSTSSPIFGGLAIIQMLLLLAVLRGLYKLERSGRFGRMGLIIASVGVGLMVAAFLVSPLRSLAGWAWFIGVPALAGGWLLFGVANLRTKALPRWNRLPLSVGLVPVLISISHDAIGIGWTLPVGSTMLGLGWVLLGYVLCLGTVHSGPDLQPASVGHP